jgi:hypothetical protein
MSFSPILCMTKFWVPSTPFPPQCICLQSRSTSVLQAGELSENSLISEIFVSSSEKIRQVFLVNAYAFRDFFYLLIEFSEIFSTLCSPPWSCFLIIGTGTLYLRYGESRLNAYFLDVFDKFASNKVFGKSGNIIHQKNLQSFVIFVVYFAYFSVLN